MSDLSDIVFNQPHQEGTTFYRINFWYKHQWNHYDDYVSTDLPMVQKVTRQLRAVFHHVEVWEVRSNYRQVETHLTRITSL